MEHKLKILPQYFKAVQEGTKTFELRKNDRGFKVGDILILREWIKRDLQRESNFTGNEIKKEISYVLEGGKYGLEEGYCILGLKEEGIILKNIDLTGISIMEQLNKVKEEDKEFMIAIELQDKENAIEELFDKVQSSLGLLEKVFGISADDVMKEYPKHLEKLKSRPRQKKECKKCSYRENCCLYLSENWGGESEAESCKVYKEE